MGEQLDDSKFVDIVLEPTVVPPKLVLLTYSPQESSLKKGEEVRIDVTVRNDGGDGDYFIRLIDLNGSDQGVCGISYAREIIDTEPDIFTGISAGETKTVEVNTDGWCGAMPDESPAGTPIPIGGTWDLLVTAWHET